MTNHPNIAFLGYDDQQTKLLEFCRQQSCDVTHIDNHDHIDDVVSLLLLSDLIISFGYRHIIPYHILQQIKRPILNLHISYLPYNRGSHPNFWAFYDHTPHGTTIHEMNEKCDEGDIIIQQQYDDFHDLMPLSHSYDLLIQRIENCFIDHWQMILSGNYHAQPQIGKGSFHKGSDLPKWHGGWGLNIKQIKNKLHL